MNGPLFLAPAAGTAAFLLALLLTPLVRRYAVRRALLDRVRDDRWHSVPTPALGGIAIFAAFVSAALAGLLALRSGTLVGLGADGSPGVGIPLFEAGGAEASIGSWTPLVDAWSPGLAILAAALVMFVTGLVDDHRPLGVVGKLLPQIGAAVILVASGVMLGLSGLYPVDVAISVFWFVGITNAVNLLDNMDGLAGGVAVIAALVLGALFLTEGRGDLALVALALAGAAGGFLVHNHPPARIFMGDSGALVLGMVLAGLALSPVPGGGRGVLAVLSVPVSLLAIPILDTALVTTARVMEGRSPAQGGRDHTSHRLVALGIPERRAVYLLWLLAALGGAVAFLLQTTTRGVAALLGGGLLLGLLLLGGRLLQVPLSHHLAVHGPDARVRRAALWDRARPVFLMGVDVLVVVLAYHAAYLVRWSPVQLEAEMSYFQRSLPLLVGAKLLGFGLGGLYGRAGAAAGWRLVVRGSTLGSLTAVAVLLLVAGFGLSRGVLLLDFAFCTALVLAVRRVPGLHGEGR